MPRILRMSSLLSTASGMALVIGTAVLVTVALAMALVGPSRSADAARGMSARSVEVVSDTAPAPVAVTATHAAAGTRAADSADSAGGNGSVERR